MTVADLLQLARETQARCKKRYEDESLDAVADPLSDAVIELLETPNDEDPIEYVKFHVRGSVQRHPTICRKLAVALLKAADVAEGTAERSGK